MTGYVDSLTSKCGVSSSSASWEFCLVDWAAFDSWFCCGSESCNRDWLLLKEKSMYPIMSNSRVHIVATKWMNYANRLTSATQLSWRPPLIFTSHQHISFYIRADHFSISISILHLLLLSSLITILILLTKVTWAWSTTAVRWHESHEIGELRARRIVESSGGRHETRSGSWMKHRQLQWKNNKQGEWRAAVAEHL